MTNAAVTRQIPVTRNLKGMRKLIRTLLATLLAAMASLVVAPAARADGSAPINWWNVDVTLTEDGVAHIEMEWEMDFTKTEGRGPILQLSTRQASDQPGQ